MQSTTEGVAGSVFNAAARLSNCCGERLAKFAASTSVAMFSMAMSTSSEISSGLLPQSRAIFSTATTSATASFVALAANRRRARSRAARLKSRAFCKCGNSNWGPSS